MGGVIRGFFGTDYADYTVGLGVGFWHGLHGLVVYDR